ncbi:MAG TPA: flagellar hook-associated protein FlgL, partial [Stellaceae bacterium]|nr:flagellar hook-associated protein FlgL [Stellaceae bacterium]
LGSLPDLLTQQSNVNQLDRQIATGQTMLGATADPAGAGLSLQTADAVQHFAYDAGNAESAAQTIGTTLSALQQVADVIDQLRQTAVEGASAATTASMRAGLVAVAQNALQQLMALGNTQGADGSYVFAGSNAKSAPFVTAADGQIAFVGDGATNAVEIAPGLSVPVTVSGQGIFMNIPAGKEGVAVVAQGTNTGSAYALAQGVTDLGQLTAARLAGTQYEIAFGAGSGGALTYTVASGAGSPGTSGFAASSGTIASGSFSPGADLRFAGLDVAIDGTPAAGDKFVVEPGATASLFTTVQDLIAALAPPPAGQPASSQAQQQIENVIANLDGAQNSVLSAEASLGATLAQIEGVRAQDQTQGTDAAAALTNLQSADLPQVLANYSAGVTALQAAELAFARIQNLTLFSVIRS